MPLAHEGQKTAQRDIATALETALDARRQRIIISESQVNLLKWACLFMQAVCALVAIAVVRQPACLYYRDGTLRDWGSYITC
jgi:hypothetical protein